MHVVNADYCTDVWILTIVNQVTLLPQWFDSPTSFYMHGAPFGISFYERVVSPDSVVGVKRVGLLFIFLLTSEGFL